MKQAQRLAAVYDPSGTLFNVGPVILQEDGTVITAEALKRRQAKFEAKATGAVHKSEESLELAKMSIGVVIDQAATPVEKTQRPTELDVQPDLLDASRPSNNGQSHNRLRNISKTQQKKLAALEPRPPPPKPVIPEAISLPEGEENWLALWDLPDGELERRTVREKRRKAAERKALRVKQKCGKAERRLARDEKRRIYRETKLEWKTIKGRLSSNTKLKIPADSSVRASNKRENETQGHGRRRSQENCS